MEFVLSQIAMERRETPSADRMMSTRWALASLSLSMLLSSLGTSIASVALPTLADAFNASFQEVQWVVLAYLLAITTLIVSVGRLGDMIGRRRFLVAAILLFTGASFLCAVAPTLPLLIAGRAAQGLGAAAMMALTIAFVSETVAKERTGSAMGLLGTMSAIGTASGPSLGGILISALGWRAIFLVGVPLGLVAAGLACRFLPADRRGARTKRTRLDYVGTLLLALTLAAYALAMTTGRGQFGLLNAGLLSAAALGIGLFVLVETRAASPLIRPGMFRDPALSANLVMSLLVAAVIMTTFVVGPFYLSVSLGLDAVRVGAVMSVGPIISALTGVLAGRIVDRAGARSTVIAGLAAMAAGALALSVLPTSFGPAAYIAGIAILTPGYQLFQAANNTAVMADVDTDQRGVVSGLLNLSRNLGLITGASVMGAVFALASATTDMMSAPAATVASGAHVTFAVAAGLIVIAIVVGSLALRRTAQRPTS
jgi:EmrB/QacA subfamily drug resistance transporter